MKIIAANVLDMIVTHFRTHHRSFRLYTPQRNGERHFEMYHHYAKFNMTIVIVLPLILDNKGELCICGNIFRIMLTDAAIHKTMPPLFLRNTLLTNDWKKSINKKIAILTKLLRDSKRCTSCSQWMKPHISQRKPPHEKTHFVSFYCRKCNVFTPTTFGIGLKTELHKYMKVQT